MIDLELIQTLIPLIISGITLFIGIRIFYIFHRREVQKKQLELILRLIENFQKCDFNISLANYSKTATFYAHIDKGNLFSIAKTRFNRKTTTLSNLEIFYFPVYMTEETVTRIQISEFILNPILPNKIAKCLQNAFPENITYSRRDSAEYNLVLIDEFRTLDIKRIKESKNQIQKNPQIM